MDKEPKLPETKEIDDMIAKELKATTPKDKPKELPKEEPKDPKDPKPKAQDYSEQVMALRDEGVYRLEHLKRLDELESILIEFGKSLFKRLDTLNKNLEQHNENK